MTTPDRDVRAATAVMIDAATDPDATLGEAAAAARSALTKFEMNPKWAREYEKFRKEWKPPPGLSEKELADAVAKEMKRRGLTE